jgi:hypothetical protein
MACFIDLDEDPHQNKSNYGTRQNRIDLAHSTQMNRRGCFMYLDWGPSVALAGICSTSLKRSQRQKGGSSSHVARCVASASLVGIWSTRPPATAIRLHPSCLRPPHVASPLWPQLRMPHTTSPPSPRPSSRQFASPPLPPVDSHLRVVAGGRGNEKP